MEKYKRKNTNEIQQQHNTVKKMSRETKYVRKIFLQNKYISLKHCGNKNKIFISYKIVTWSM